MKNQNCKKCPYKPLHESYKGYYRNLFNTNFSIFVNFLYRNSFRLVVFCGRSLRFYVVLTYHLHVLQAHSLFSSLPCVSMCEIPTLFMSYYGYDLPSLVPRKWEKKAIPAARVRYFLATRSGGNIDIFYLGLISKYAFNVL